MLRGATCSAAAIVGTAVLRIVVSSDSMKNATAISHGSSRLLVGASEGCAEGVSSGSGGLKLGGLGCIGLRTCLHQSSTVECQLSLRLATISRRRMLEVLRALAYGMQFRETERKQPRHRRAGT